MTALRSGPMSLGIVQVQKSVSSQTVAVHIRVCLSFLQSTKHSEVCSQFYFPFNELAFFSYNSHIVLLISQRQLSDFNSHSCIAICTTNFRTFSLPGGKIAYLLRVIFHLIQCPRPWRPLSYLSITRITCFTIS